MFAKTNKILFCTHYRRRSKYIIPAKLNASMIIFKTWFYAEWYLTEFTNKTCSLFNPVAVGTPNAP